MVLARLGRACRALSAAGCLLATVSGVGVHAAGAATGAVDRIGADESRPDPNLPSSRSFRMGFTQWPYDFTDKAVARTYDAIARHADIVAIHLDGGVPWPEALAGTPFPPNVESDLAAKAAQARRFDAVYVAATPLGEDRLTLAPYWAEDTGMPLPDGWQDKALDDPDVVAAYLSFCRRLIDLFDPDYFAYGIETNASYLPDDPRLQRFKRLARQVFRALKRDNPALPILLTFQTGSDNATPEQQRQVSEQLVPYSDIIGVSSYPYFPISGFSPDEADVTYLPDDWFARMANLAPDKPFAITETGYVAEDLRIPEYGVDTKGRARWQRRYIEYLLRRASELDTVFVIYWEIRDYDRLYRRLQQLGLDEPLFLVWKDIGLLDGRGRKRPGLRRWDAWLRLPRRRELR